jgi:hypothetical protein
MAVRRCRSRASQRNAPERPPGAAPRRDRQGPDPNLGARRWGGWKISGSGASAMRPGPGSSQSLGSSAAFLNALFAASPPQRTAYRYRKLSPSGSRYAAARHAVPSTSNARRPTPMRWRWSPGSIRLAKLRPRNCTFRPIAHSLRASSSCSRLTRIMLRSMSPGEDPRIPVPLPYSQLTPNRATLHGRIVGAASSSPDHELGDSARRGGRISRVDRTVGCACAEGGQTRGSQLRLARRPR